MEIRQYELWLADLNSALGTEPRRTRPVVIIQTDLLNEVHPSTIVCPVTTNVKHSIDLLRIHLKKSQLEKPSDVLIDQMRAIDNRRFVRKLGTLTKYQIKKIQENIKIVLDLQ